VAPNVKCLQLLYEFSLETFVYSTGLNVLMVERIKMDSDEQHVCMSASLTSLVTLIRYLDDGMSRLQQDGCFS